MELKLVKLEVGKEKETIFNIIKSLQYKVSITEYGYHGILIDSTVYYNNELNNEDLIIAIYKELIIPNLNNINEYKALTQLYSEEIIKCTNTISAIEYEQSICVYEGSYYNNTDYERSIKAEESRIEKYQELIDLIFYHQVCINCSSITNCMGGDIFTCKKYIIH